ncbi:MAG: hypothetical protein RL283_376 [Actinomycetota bacterium]
MRAATRRTVTVRLRTARLAAAAAISAALALVAPVGTPPAHAHAGLRTTEPAASSVLERAPERIVLTFGEAVEIEFGAIRLFDGGGSLVAIGAPRHLDAPSVVAADVPALAPGSYLVAWRVVSTDSHPVQGAFTFQIGLRGTDLSALSNDILRDGAARPEVRTAMGLARWLAYLGVVLVAGAWILGAMARAPHEPAPPRVGAAARAGIALLVGGTLGTYVVQPAYAIGGGATIHGTWRYLDDLAATRLGTWLLIRVAAIAAFVAWTRARPALAVAVLASFAVPGHPGMRSPAALSVANDVVHLGAASAWIGGVVALAVAGAAWRARRVDAVAAFSRWAGALLAITLATGVAQALRMTDLLRRATDDLPGGVGEALTSTYGRTLGVKSALVAGVVALGATARRAVRGRSGTPSTRTLARESVLAAAVLAATTVLVSVPPLATLGAEPWTTTVARGPLVATVTVTPARVGLADVHVVYSPPGGTLERVRAVEAVLRSDADPATGIVVPLELAGPNHAVGRVQLPAAGQWRLVVDTVDASGATVRLEAPVTVRG